MNMFTIAKPLLPNLVSILRKLVEGEGARCLITVNLCKFVNVVEY